MHIEKSICMSFNVRKILLNYESVFKFFYFIHKNIQSTILSQDFGGQCQKELACDTRRIKCKLC